MRPRVLLLTALALAGFGCNRPPTRGELNGNQMAMDMAEAVNDLRAVNGELRNSLDSLTRVVARQDTVLRLVANATGVQLPPR